MTTKELLSKYEGIILSLNQKELKTAFDLLQQATEASHCYLFQDELFELQETYKQLLHYYAAGMNDPMRLKIFSKLMASVYEIADKFVMNVLGNDLPSMYFSIRRTLSAHPEKIASLTKTLPSVYDIQNLLHAEELMIRLFKAVWTSVLLSDADAEGCHLLLTQDITHDNTGYMTLVNCQLVSALTLGLQSLFDKRKLLLLFDAADSLDTEVKIRAYVGILLTLYKYLYRIEHYPEIQYRIDALAENVDFKKIVYLIILRFIMSRDTEKITAKMRTEFLPEMLKFSKKINPQTAKKEDSKKDMALEFFDLEMNPEWMEKFENSPLGKKIEEFNRLQEEGADVMHFSFVNLKNFPFFNEISNWFLPFHTGMSFMMGDNAGTKTIELMSQAGIICNSDMYSLYFSIKNMYKDSPLTLLDKLESQLSELKQQKSADLQTRDDKTERIISHYVQDLYRFFKLFPRRTEFSDIFRFALDFHNLSVIQRYFSDKTDLLNIAEFCLRKNHFIDALTIYNRLTDPADEDEMLFQKKGYCLQMTGDYKSALSAFEKAELINPDSKWLLRRIAQCYRADKNPEMALKYYSRLEKFETDNLSVLLTIGSCYLEMKNYTEALQYFFKVDYLSHASGKAWRPIAWCSFLMGKYEQAISYYNYILSSNPGFQDYTNAGHAEWALHQMQNAFAYYLKSIQAAENNFDTFSKEFSKDIPDLIAAGIRSEEIPFLLDKLRYETAQLPL